MLKLDIKAMKLSYNSNQYSKKKRLYDTKGLIIRVGKHNFGRSLHRIVH